MILLTHYESAVKRGDIVSDPIQRAVLIAMQKLVDGKNKSNWFRRRQPLKGIYLHGSVGVGKTFLIDLLFKHLSERKKARYHFHHFMQQVDIKLRKIQGQKNPLIQVAKDIAKTTRILCFDEFLVHDVAHAMILAELLQALMRCGVLLVISSNTAPDELYHHGIQRARFLPAIELIKTHCELIHLTENTDYRRGRPPDFKAYLHPLNEHNQDIMNKQFEQINPKVEAKGVISVQNRDIPFLKRGAKSIWFDFNTICNLPRCQSDYLEIANRFETIFLSDIPALDEHAVAALLFIYFIDVLYDRGIRLIVSAEVPVEELYQKGRMQEAFKRTSSRLLEMQAVDYLQRHPRRLDRDM